MRCFPQIQRFGRLDIVVAVEEQRFVTSALTFPEDDRFSAGGLHFGGEDALAQHSGHQRGAFLNPQVLRPYRRLGHQPG